jgi:hypothetical protein
MSNGTCNHARTAAELPKQLLAAEGQVGSD